MHMITLGNGVGARVEAAALQGSHRKGIESEIETDRMATMPGGIGYARKVQAEGETTTTTEAETERRTGERGGDRPETLSTIHHLPGPKGPGARPYLSWATRPPAAATSVDILPHQAGYPGLPHASSVIAVDFKLRFCREDLFVTG